MGFAKVFAPLRGTPPLARLALLLQGRDAVAVVPPDRENDARAMAPELRVVANAHPERGMTHSLRLALATFEGDFGVLLGDKPFVSARTLASLEEALGGADVAYPVRAQGVPGHPVLFSASARAFVERLPDGDTISQLRDEPALRRVMFESDDPGAFADFDAPEEWGAADA